MATTITVKLNKDATQFQAGESTGFGVRGGVQYYDRETKTKMWTNYEAAIFVRNPSQIQFYQTALVAGSVVEISGRSERIREFQGNNGLILSIELLDASIGYIHTDQQAPAQQPRQPAPQAQPQYQPQQSPQYQQPAQQPYVDQDPDSIPF